MANLDYSEELFVSEVRRITEMDSRVKEIAGDKQSNKSEKDVKISN